MTSIVTRFAPSPTGALHLGHAYSAVLAHARAAADDGGHFHVRIDDLDPGRSRAAFVDAALADLAWLGLDWTPPLWRQSDRLADYDKAMTYLRDAGLLYPCFCTRADIAASVAAPHGPSGPVYPGTCRDLAPAVTDRRRAEAPHCWRLDMARALASIAADKALAPNDAAAVRAHGDVVLGRKDAPASYHLASTIDDAAMGVTDVVRGADLAAAEPLHRLLQRLLGLPTPRYHHHALVVGADGRRLAKRDGAAALAALAAAGVDGRALAKDLRAGRLPTGYSLQMP